MKRLCAVSVCVASLVVARGAQVPLPPVLSVQVSSGYVQLSIRGNVGNACTIQYRDGLSPADNWQFLTNLTPMSSSPCTVVDTGATSVLRLYRAFLQQVPTNVIPWPNMVWISPGTFVMGSPTSEAMRRKDETQHTVTLTKGFYMSKCAVTQDDYLKLMGSNPSYCLGDLSRPVEQVNWDDATNYCAHLTQQEQAAGRLPAGWVYRLPTESEREYACRAGTTTAFHYGSRLASGMANFDGHYEYDASAGEICNASGICLNRTTTVGSYQANAWGLYDMHGNVWEWCRDWYGAYSTGSVTHPQGPASGGYRVMRGGSWCVFGRCCRSAPRDYDTPSFKSPYVGFRVVLAPGQP